MSIGIINESRSERADCPSCGGRNTLSVRKVDGYVNYHCFRASCNYSTRKHVGLSLQEVQEHLSLHPVRNEIPKWVGVPAHWVPVDTRKECLDFIRRYHCVSFYLDHPDRFRFDPASSRLCFLSVVDTKVVGATGRVVTLYGTKITAQGPKWFIYDSSLYPFVCASTNSHTVCIVEDCPSACAAYGAGITGIALRGTNLNSTQIAYIRELKPERCIIALDKDATKKSFDMARRLSQHINTEVAMLDQDLKYLDANGIKKVLKL